jgi:hypothetical protein
MAFSPLMRSITLSINTVTQLSVKLAALDPNLPTRLAQLYLEYDLTSTGNLYVGNNATGAPALSATNCGRHLVPAQNQNVMALDTGMILTTDIFLLSDSATNQINVIALPIGM